MTLLYVEENDDKDIQEIKDQYNFDDIKNELEGGKFFMEEATMKNSELTAKC